MTSATYGFTRKPFGAIGRPNRPSTDALGVLWRWRALSQAREYEILVDEDERLVARLTWAEGDARAGPDLDAQCDGVAIERNFQD